MTTDTLIQAARDARDALEPFVALSDKRDEVYRKRGGKPEGFPDTHPAYDISAGQMKIGVWRRARVALDRLDAALASGDAEPVAWDEADDYGFIGLAASLESRASRFRSMGGNLLMYGEAQAEQDDRAAAALRRADRMIDKLIWTGRLAAAPAKEPT